MATHSSIFDGEVPWTEEPGRLPYMGLQSWTRLRNNSRKNEGMEPKQKEYPAVDVSGDIEGVSALEKPNREEAFDFRFF